MSAMFAVVVISGKQHVVRVDDEIVVEHIDGNDGDTTVFDEVLLVSDEKKTEIGTPTVKDVVVQAVIVKQQRGEKVRVRRFRAKSRYRRAVGFRQEETVLKITSIGKQSVKSASKTKKRAKKSTSKKSSKTKNDKKTTKKE